MSEKTGTARMGRPPLPDGEVRRPRSIGVKDAEWQRWQDAAAAEGVSLSEWLRGLANRRAAKVL